MVSPMVLARDPALPSGDAAPDPCSFIDHKSAGADPGAETSSELKQESNKRFLSQRKKWSLLAVFSLAFFIDIWSYSAFFIFIGPISENLGVVFEQQSWVINSYSVTFASFLLFWGRFSDLFSAKSVFTFGFISLGCLNLIISFLPDKYSFFVFRALSGIAGAALIPAAFRLIVAVFEPKELGKAFTIYGMSGAVANTTGIIVAGFVEYIPNTGQMAAWRWFFRILAAVILPFAVGSLFWVPSPAKRVTSVTKVWKRLDIVGSISMLLAIALLILSLTLGASDGWGTAQFIVPFVLSLILFPLFFLWEARIPAENALLPQAVWRIPNFAMFISFALYLYAWWSLNFLPFVETFTQVRGDLPVIAAVRMLPQGLAAAATTILLTIYPRVVANPRWPIVGGMLAGMVGYILFILSNGQTDDRYWKFIFTGGIIGSGGMMIAFTATNVGIMTAVPPEMAGVAGAILQVSLQVGSAVALSIEAGLFTIAPGNLSNWVNVRAAFIFALAWGFLWLVGFLVSYRPNKRETEGGPERAE